MNRRIPVTLVGLLFVGLCADCSLIASSDLKSGIGDACSSADDCQGGVCDQGLCAHECTTNSNCPDPSICVSGLCKLGCLEDTSCATGQICEGNACQVGCRTDDTCAQGNICEGTACVPGCREDTECGAGKICADKICAVGCRDDDACGKGSICEANACTPGCRNTAGCPDGEYCDTGACKPTLAVSAIFTGDSERPAEHAITASHRLGLDQAVTAAPYVQFGEDRYQITESANTAPLVDDAIEAAIEAGAKVIVTTTSVANARALLAAAANPNVKFMVTGTRANGALTNVGAYSGKTDQLWFATGKLVAREADSGTKCVGLVLPSPTKQIVRETNAFTRGVNSFDSQIKVVIRWLGATMDSEPSGQPAYAYKANNYTFDTAQDGKLYREELLAAQLADLGCTVVAHRTDTQRVIGFVDSIANRVNVAKPPGNHNLFSLSVDVKNGCRDNAQSAGTWFASCLGVPYWNWGPVYSKVFDEMYRDVWTGQVVRYDFQVGATGIMKFELSPYTTATGISSADADNVMAAAANAGVDAVFRGPYGFTGQRDLNKDGVADTSQNVANGIPVAEEELDRMCWFVQGVYELPVYSVVDYGSLIPAMVPYGPSVTGQVTTLDTSPDSQQKYGDVGTFITTKLSKNPSEVMSCPLN